MLKRCFLAVDTTDLRSAKICAPSRVRKQPEIFIACAKNRTKMRDQVLAFIEKWTQEHS